MGRPSKYSEKLGEACAAMFEAHSGGLRAAFAARNDLPDITTVYRWEESIPAFRDRMTRARQIRAHQMADEAVAIADAGEDDTITRTARDGTEYESANHEWINRSRLRVDTRLKVAKAMNPRAYGDRTEQTGTVEVVHRIHIGPKPE